MFVGYVQVHLVAYAVVPDQTGVVLYYFHLCPNYVISWKKYCSCKDIFGTQVEGSPPMRNDIIVHFWDKLSRHELNKQQIKITQITYLGKTNVESEG